ncbi:MAG: GTP 3',8-cyclase MoaA [Conexivisphaerales archaeon]|nr:GTP 3',8-cyclase MoaA [Conexivisphaerales archaeon]
MLVDRFSRIAEKLRLSVTDRCNYRCVFCMPSNPDFVKEEDVLKLDEIYRIGLIFKDFGIKELKLTGGEPLLREDLQRIVSFASQLYEVSLTTNGYMLLEKAPSLSSNGLRRVNVSLHSLKEDRYYKITGTRGLEKVLRGLEVAKEQFEQIKINVTLIKGLNEDEIFDFIDFSRKTGYTVRFLEYEPFDGNGGWSPSKVVTAGDVIKVVSKKYNIKPLDRSPHSTSTYFEIKEYGVKFGVIPSVSQPFCTDCNRVRVTSEGVFLPCMYSLKGLNIKEMMRQGRNDEEIKEAIKDVYKNKFEGIIKYVKQNKIPERVIPMYKLGG